MRRILPVFCLAVLALSACTPNGTSEQDSSSSSSESLVTHNVTYRGLLEEAGPTIYQEGTHRLTLDDGRFILLESNGATNLGIYEGERVEVMGSTRATVEAGGTIMSVDTVERLDASSSSSTSSSLFCGGIAGIACPSDMNCIDDPTDSCDPLQGGADCGGICVPAASSSSVSTTSAATSSASQQSSASSISSVAPASSAPSSAPAASSSSVATSASADLEAKIVAMADEDFSDSSRWSQTYCTSHIGFCIPVHKNWYFRSFGATSSALWHVEFSNADFETLGSGVIMLNLLPGTSASSGGTSGQVSVQGSQVVGYLDWQDGQHVEITADARLRDAIGYMIMHITAAPSA